MAADFIHEYQVLTEIRSPSWAKGTYEKQVSAYDFMTLITTLLSVLLKSCVYVTNIS